MASRIVQRWSSGSGTSPPSAARESIASGGTGESIVRFSVRGAGSPGAGSAGRAATEKLAWAATFPTPSTSARSSTT